MNFTALNPIILLLIAFWTAISAVSSDRKPNAVSPLIGYENYYLGTKESSETKREMRNETAQEKVDICARIIGSPLFSDLHDLDAVDPRNRATYDELLQQYPEIYRHLYQSKNSSKSFQLTNSYKIRDVTVNGNVVREKVFSCVARNRKSERKIVEYFVSSEYILNTAEKLNDPEKLIGRFVFARNGGKTIVVSALAEASASALSPSEVTNDLSRLEVYREEGVSYESKEKENTICALPISQKIRLCVLALSAEKYHDQVRFLPCEKNVDPKCVLREIDHDDYHDWTYYYDNTQEDWVIGCKARKVDINEPVTFYLSRGVEDIPYFICRVNLSGQEETAFLNGIIQRINVHAGDHKTYRDGTLV